MCIQFILKCVTQNSLQAPELLQNGDLTTFRHARQLLTVYTFIILIKSIITPKILIVICLVFCVVQSILVTSTFS